MEACTCQNGLISRKTPRIFIANSRKLMNIYEKCASYFPKTMAGGRVKGNFFRNASILWHFVPEFKLVSGACSVSLQIIVDENRSFESGTNPHPVSRPNCVNVQTVWSQSSSSVISLLWENGHWSPPHLLHLNLWASSLFILTIKSDEILNYKINDINIFSTNNTEDNPTVIQFFQCTIRQLEDIINIR